MKSIVRLNGWPGRSIGLLGAVGGLGLLAMTPLAFAQQSADSQLSRDISERDTQVHDTLREQGREWGLNDREWERYETLMEGSRGIWSPDLDPLTVLGVEARTGQERRRYAELLVEVEKARVERELAFQRAYDEAWQRRYPDELPVDQFMMGDPGQGSVGFFQEPASQAPRLSVHVAAQDCASCDAAIQELLDSGVAMDVFVIDSDGDDSIIREWAREHSIPVSRVQTREITLNHGQADASLGVTRDDVPQVFTR